MNQETANPKANISQLCRLNINPQTDVAQRVSDELHAHCPGYYSDWADNGTVYACQCPHHVGEPETIAIAL